MYSKMKGQVKKYSDNDIKSSSGRVFLKEVSSLETFTDIQRAY